MPERVACSSCGALNPAGAAFCGQCFAPDPGAASALSPAPVAAGVGGLGAYDLPAPAPAFTGLASAPPQAVPAAGPAGTKAVWRWSHLVLVGLFILVVPGILFASTNTSRLSIPQLLSAAMAIQILAYAMALAVVYGLVRVVHAGDWSSVGLARSNFTPEDLFQGAVYGAILFGVWFPIGFAAAGGHIRFQGLVHALIGDTNEAGLLLAAVVLVVGAPLAEEIYFRGMLYERFVRRGRWVAVVGTSLLFVGAHGSVLILPLLILAFGLAWKRQDRSLWFTIGGHAAWNFIIVCLGSYLILAPARVFSPPDHAYTLRYPARWERVSKFEQEIPFGASDLALTASGGSFIGVERFHLPLNVSDEMLRRGLEGVHRAMGAQFQSSPPAQSNVDFPGVPPAYEMSGPFKGPHVHEGRMRLVAVAPAGGLIVLFIMGCERRACPAIESDFAGIMSSTVFGGG